jgi:hypothetical protein
LSLSRDKFINKEFLGVNMTLDEKVEVNLYAAPGDCNVEASRLSKIGSLLAVCGASFSAGLFFGDVIEDNVGEMGESLFMISPALYVMVSELSKFDYKIFLERGLPTLFFYGSYYAGKYAAQFYDKLN